MVGTYPLHFQPERETQRNFVPGTWYAIGRETSMCKRQPSRQCLALILKCFAYSMHSGACRRERRSASRRLSIILVPGMKHLITGTAHPAGRFFELIFSAIVTVQMPSDAPTETSLLYESPYSCYVHPLFWRGSALKIVLGARYLTCYCFLL